MCRRGRLSILGWDNCGCLNGSWCGSFLAKLVYDYRPHEISLGGRLLKTLPKINMSMKGQKQNVTPMLTCNPNDNWPRFLVVEARDGNPKRLTDRMDVFAWHKAIKGMGGSYKFVKSMNDDKQLLVHFENKAYSDNHLRAEKLIDVPVKVTPHRALNSSRCVIGCKELRNMKRTSKMNCNHKVLPKLNAWRGERMGSWYLQIHTYWPLIVQTFLSDQSWFPDSWHKVYIPNQIHNVVLIVNKLKDL